MYPSFFFTIPCVFFYSQAISQGLQNLTEVAPTSTLPIPPSICFFYFDVYDAPTLLKTTGFSQVCLRTPLSLLSPIIFWPISEPGGPVVEKNHFYHRDARGLLLQPAELCESPRSLSFFQLAVLEA